MSNLYFFTHKSSIKHTPLFGSYDCIKFYDALEVSLKNFVGLDIDLAYGNRISSVIKNARDLSTRYQDELMNTYISDSAK